MRDILIFLTCCLCDVMAQVTLSLWEEVSVRSRLKSVASGMMDRGLTLILSGAHHKWKITKRKGVRAGSS